MECTQKPTAHEMLQLRELIRLEAIELQKVRSVLPMIGDGDLREHLDACEQTGQAHVKALVAYCEKAGVAH